MPLYRIEAVVLSHRYLGEADKIVTLYSREKGKVRAVAGVPDALAIAF
jgi:DNA repair protein RecO (recombination protein O)